MLRDLWIDPSQKCRGLLSVLYAGETPIEYHYGMLENDILHYWFPTYETTHQQYSPGTAIFLEIAKLAPVMSIGTIDLGIGDHPYKHKFADTIISLPMGCISHYPLRFVKEKVRLAISENARKLPGKAMLKKIVRGAWPSFGKELFQ